MKQPDQKYCVECGQLINAKAEICPYCGVKQPAYYAFNPQNTTNNDIDGRWIATLLFCFFLGVFGVHRFYVGKIGTGILQLVTLGGCGIWYIVDLVMIIIGQFKDGDGNIIRSPLIK